MFCMGLCLRVFCKCVVRGLFCVGVSFWANVDIVNVCTKNQYLHDKQIMHQCVSLYSEGHLVPDRM